jgi:Lon protease-like protein
MELFVFPLGHMLLYPSFSKPFHIYEPRYVQMVEDSIRTGTPIAIGNVFEIDENHEYRFGEPLSFVSQIVGFGMPVIVEKSQNGSMIIFLEGKGKARLGTVVDKKTSYIVCEAEKIPENHDIGSDQLPTLDVACKVMVHWMNGHISDPSARDQFLNYVRSPEQVIGCYASYLVADHDLQQYILEINDINEKLDIIARLIASGELVA